MKHMDYPDGSTKRKSYGKLKHSGLKDKYRTLRYKHFYCALGIVLIIFLFLFIVNIYVLLSTPKQYMVTSDNYIDYQLKYECSGYSAAYVLRSMGEKADGLSIYQNNPYKNNDGTVSPGNLVKFLEESGYKVKLCSGTVMQIKYEVSKDIPVIAFVRTSPQESYYHYLPVVGYDTDNIYVADSLKKYINADEQYYNRVLSETDFEEMLETGIFRKNTYIVLEQKH